MTSTAEQIRTAEARPLPKARWRRVLPVCLWLLGLALLTGAGLESYRVLIGRNLHTVLPGRVYRSAQPSLASLQALVKKHGIRTVLNLRGGSPPLPWYQREAAATCELDLCQEDVNLSAGRLPSSTELRRLVEVLDRTEYPMLIHCRRGSDRTGLVATLILLLQEGSNFEQACGQLSMRYGHVSLGRTEHMHGFFQLYADWLRQQQQEHSAALFRRWLLQEYQGHRSYVFEKVEFPDQPLRVGQPLEIQVRLRNTGKESWHFSPLRNAGHHLVYILYGPHPYQLMADRAGLLAAEVKPGETTDLTVALPPLREAGEYRLVMDMSEEQLGYFYQMGSEILEMRLTVRE